MSTQLIVNEETERPNVDELIADALASTTSEPGKPKQPRKRDSTAEGLRRIVAGQLAIMKRNEDGCRRGDAMEAIHGMRVAIRRLRTALKLWDGKDADPCETFENNLRDLHAKLGAVRDRDVQLERLGARLNTLGESDAQAFQIYLTHIQDERKHKLEELREFLDSETYQSIYLFSLEQNVSSNGTSPAERFSESAARHAKKRVKRVIDAAAEIDADTSSETLHAFRKDVKKARYAMEQLKPFRGKALKKGLKELKALQDLAGKHNDAAVAQEMARVHAQDATDATPASTWLVLGISVALDREEEEKARAAFSGKVKRKRLKKRLKRALA